MKKRELSFIHVVQIEDGQVSCTVYRHTKDENGKVLQGSGTNRTYIFEHPRAREHFKRFCRAGMNVTPIFGTSSIFLSLWPTRK